MRELYQVVEVGPAWYQENIPCQEACPVKTNCRGYLNLAAAGEFEKGWELALDPNPMASICGSVCAAPCETACRRKEVDKPLSIRYVKKFLSDWTHQNVRTDGHAYTQPPAPVFGPPRGTVAPFLSVLLAPASVKSETGQPLTRVERLSPTWTVAWPQPSSHSTSMAI